MAVIIIIAALATVLVLTAKIAYSQIIISATSTSNKIETLKPIELLPEPITLTKRQRAWMGALSWCESHHNDSAINKVDRDGTPSYGRYQFKPSTFYYFMKRYEIGTSTNYMDGDLQEKIVEQMIIRNDVKWSTQFPDCVKKLGTPPLSTVKN